jgi:hypothetical protein
MPKTITKTVYFFKELDDQAKERARDWFREVSAGDNDFADYVIEDAATIADMLGIDLRQRPVKLMNGSTRYEPAIYWSGFSSQGDGASFEGRYSFKADCLATVSAHAPQDETLHAIARVLQDNGRDLVATVKHVGRYYHENSMSIDVATDEDEAALPEAADAVTEALRDFARWIYKQLESEYEFQNSNEQVDESINANEYTFTENGRRSC